MENKKWILGGKQPNAIYEYFVYEELKSSIPLSANS